MSINWWDMPESTPEEKALKEIEECKHCINGLCRAMVGLGVPDEKWGENLMVKEYLKRMENAKLFLSKEGRYK